MVVCTAQLGVNGCDVYAPLTHAMVVYVLNGPSVFIAAMSHMGEGSFGTSNRCAKWPMT